MDAKIAFLAGQDSSLSIDPDGSFLGSRPVFMRRIPSGGSLAADAEDDLILGINVSSPIPLQPYGTNS